jgi:hypothetical protein
MKYTRYNLGVPLGLGRPIIFAVTREDDVLGFI